MATIAPTSPLSRAVRKVATSSVFRRVGPRVVPPLDKVVHRVSRGRMSVSGLIVPSMVLTTTGRKSGLPRESPLACVPTVEGGWYVVGSNFGREQHPAWTANLLANPRAQVFHRRRTVTVTARLLSDDEKAAVWPELIAVWPAYDNYVEVSGRNLRVFHLAPEADDS